MNILGISAYYHDSAACLIQNGNIIAAADEERFTRIKHDTSFPINAVKFCLDEFNSNGSNIDYVVFYDKPFLKFERLLETYLAFAPSGLLSFIKIMPLWLKDKLFQKNALNNSLKKINNDINWESKLLFSEHHLSHAASAFFPSPFESAAILTIDGVGEWSTTTLSVGKNNNIKVLQEINFPHSLGLLYSAFTFYTGFKVNSGEYKVMGLAPYGNPIYVETIKKYLIDIKEDGSFFMDMKYFNYCTGFTMTNSKFNALFGAPPRKPESPITQKEMDLAASVQKVTEEIILKLAKNARKITGEKNLCLAGGVALNCVANGLLLKENIFENIWIQPAAGDSGGSLGAALAVFYLKFKGFRKININDSMKGAYLGPSFSDAYVIEYLNKVKAPFKTFKNQDELIDFTAKVLAEGHSIGWYQGKMEFGPRSLGARSILADPRSPTMQKQLNLKIKYRESFRPFAPSILSEDLSDWFELDCDSPYMLFVSQINKTHRKNIRSELEGLEKLNQIRSTIPAVTHVDFSARIQTVNKNTNPLFHKLIKKFKDITGVPILVNTSFNIRGEPIVCKPEDAFKCFMGTDLDFLIIENNVVYKEAKKTKKNDSIINYINNNKGYELLNDGLIKIGKKRDASKIVSNFYSDAPFPNYNDFETIQDLSDKIKKNPFLNELSNIIGHNKKFIEVGAGTCQLSLALAFGTNNHFFALDPTIESLKMGLSFASQSNINNVQFINADIFDEPLSKENFDIVFCSGVLHHTEDPRKGFNIISSWLKEDGLIIIGLYNKYGRLWTILRRYLYLVLFKSNWGAKIVSLLDPYLRTEISTEKKKAWFRDQYEHPIESLHSIDEVLNWLEEEKIEFLGSIPDSNFQNFNKFADFNGNKGNIYTRIFSQINMLFNNLGKEGGLFIVIGRKKSYKSTYKLD